MVDDARERIGDEVRHQQWNDEFNINLHEYQLHSDGKLESWDHIVDPDRCIDDYLDGSTRQQQFVHDFGLDNIEPAFTELVDHARQHGLLLFDSDHKIILDWRHFRYVKHTILELDPNVIELDTDDIEYIDRLDGIDSRMLGLNDDADLLVE